MTHTGPLSLGCCSALLALGCVEPMQLGGLGVFNPNGVNGRMQLASRVNGAEGETARESEQRAESRAPSAEARGASEQKHRVSGAD
jgi:hypothetical protein